MTENKLDRLLELETQDCKHCCGDNLNEVDREEYQSLISEIQQALEKASYISGLSIEEIQQLIWNANQWVSNKEKAEELPQTRRYIKDSPLGRIPIPNIRNPTTNLEC